MMVAGYVEERLSHTGWKVVRRRMVAVVLAGYIAVVGHRIVEEEGSCKIVQELCRSMSSGRNEDCFGHAEGYFDRAEK